MGIDFEIPHFVKVVKRLADMYKYRADKFAVVKLWEIAEREYIKAECYYKLALHYFKVEKGRKP